ncbi:MAG: VCBS repeat-containing protein, partial [Myxococcales bacterium]|nr:VCBS repeat-containing protein [Myxococcales bacterium]
KDAKRLLTPEDIAAADLTGDGLLDIVIPKGDVTSVEVWTGRGRGRFRRSVDVESCYASSRALVGDFYEDGNLDVVIGCPSNFELFVGDGEGGLERRGKIGPDNAYHHAGAADFNGDGHLDLLIPTIPGGIGGHMGGFGPSAKGGRLVLLLGDGKGRFTAEDTIDLAGHQHRVVAITDIDGDEKLDAVYECFGQSPGAHIGVIFGTGCDADAP